MRAFAASSPRSTAFARTTSSAGVSRGCRPISLRKRSSEFAELGSSNASSSPCSKSSSAMVEAASSGSTRSRSSSSSSICTSGVSMIVWIGDSFHSQGRPLAATSGSDVLNGRGPPYIPAERWLITALEAALLLDRPLRQGKRLEPVVGNRLAAFHGEPVCPGSQSRLGPPQRLELAAQRFEEPFLELPLVEHTPLVGRLVLGGKLVRADRLAEVGERPLDPLALGREQLACAFRAHGALNPTRASSREDVDGRPQAPPLVEPVRVPKRYSYTPVARRERRDGGVSMHGEPAMEVERVVHMQDVEPGRLPIDAPAADRRVPGRPGRDMGNTEDLAATNLEQDLLRLVHLYVRAARNGCLRRVSAHEPAPRERADDSGSGHPLDLLERVDSIAGIGGEACVHAAECVVELAKAPLEEAHRRPVGPAPQHRRLDPRRGRRS